LLRGPGCPQNGHWVDCQCYVRGCSWSEAGAGQLAQASWPICVQETLCKQLVTTPHNQEYTRNMNTKYLTDDAALQQ
jgi:hypothetical protein